MATIANSGSRKVTIRPKFQIIKPPERRLKTGQYGSKFRHTPPKKLSPSASSRSNPFLFQGRFDRDRLDMRPYQSSVKDPYLSSRGRSTGVRRQVERESVPGLESQRPSMQTRRIENREAMRSFISQNEDEMMRFGRNYSIGLTAFNALPEIIASITNRPLQTMINYGPPAMQKAVLQGVGVKPGMGVARLVDTMIRGGTVGGVPALNWGSALLFNEAPRESLNIYRSRFQNPRSDNRQMYPLRPGSLGRRDMVRK